MVGDWGGVKVGGLRWKRGNQEGNEVQAVKVWVLGEEKQIRGWKGRAGCWKQSCAGGLGGGGVVALRRLWNQQSSCDCLESHIKAPESESKWALEIIMLWDIITGDSVIPAYWSVLTVNWWHLNMPISWSPQKPEWLALVSALNLELQHRIPARLHPLSCSRCCKMYLLCAI